MEWEDRDQTLSRHPCGYSVWLVERRVPLGGLLSHEQFMVKQWWKVHKWLSSYFTSDEGEISTAAITFQPIPTNRTWCRPVQSCGPLVGEQDYETTASFRRAQLADEGNNNVLCYSRLLSTEFNLSLQELHSEANSNTLLDNVIHIHSLTNPLVH